MPKAAKYGLFYDMMQKYMGANTLGRPSIVKKTMNSITSKKNRRESKKEMDIKGFRVSRWLLVSAKFTVQTDSHYDNAALTNPLYCQYRLFPYHQGILPTTFDYDAVQFLGPSLVLLEIKVIHPTWPGSRLCAWFNQGQGAGSANQPKWGLMCGNDYYNNNNYNWNSKAVTSTQPMLRAGNVPGDTLDLTYRTIKVYKTNLICEIWNCEARAEVDVHFVHFKLRESDVNTDQGCFESGDYNTTINKILRGDGATDTTYEKRNNSIFAFQHMIDQKKLPTKQFYTKSWRTVRLGRAINTRPNFTGATALNAEVIDQPCLTKSPYKKVTFNYGLKVWNRTQCTKEGDLFPDEMLIDRKMVDTQLMVFCTINKAYWNDMRDAAAPTTASYGITSAQVNFKWTKVNMWREDN
jgi:hypothetical protein